MSIRYGLVTRLLLVFCGLLALGVNAAAVSLPAALQQGDAALAAGRPAAALATYRQIADHAEGRRPAAPRIARALLALAQQDPADPAAYTLACDAWLDAIPYTGLTSEVHRGLAECELGRGNTLAAAAQWEIVYADDPSDPSLWYRLAPVHLARQQWAAAGRAYAALAEAEPDNLEFQYWAGLLTLQDDLAQARQHLLRAREAPIFQARTDRLLAGIGSAESLPAGRLGLLLLGAGEPGMALPHLQTAVDQAPQDDAQAWAYLGLAQDQTGRNGYPALAQALSLEPESPLAHSLMGRHWWLVGRPDLASPEFTTAWELDPDNPVHLANVAASLQAQGDLASAEAWFQAMVRRAPENTDFWVLLAHFYLDSGRVGPQDGLIAAQKAVALAPEDPTALDALGWAQLQTGDLRLAETNLLAAQRRAPGDPAVHYHLGELYRLLDRSDQAAAAFEQAILLDQPCRGCVPPEQGHYSGLAERTLEQLRVATP